MVADGVKAKMLADAGMLVFVGLRASKHTPPAEHGHVAVVVAGSLSQAKYPTAYWGSLGGSPGRAQTLNCAWKAVDLDNVHYAAKSI
ncbi:hypothetical protein GCM10009105_37570 [Dokdonella soli]|uniref:Uncharacterized protein n=1 Tax=Dokdonella soli TaxID=529810 RepID=A0ABN1IZP8_9GAMM